MRRPMSLALLVVSSLATVGEARADPVVRTTTTATSVSSDVAGTTEPEPSPGIRLARSYAKALRRDRLRRRVAHRGFASLPTSEQRAFLDEWDRITKPNARTRRVAIELRERHERRLRTERTSSKSKALTDTERLVRRLRRKPQPPAEAGLVIGEFAAAAFATLAWKLLFGVAVSGVEITDSSAVGLLTVDALATSLIAGGVTYGVGSSSDHYVVSFGTAVGGAALGYGLTILLAVAVVSNEQPSNRFSNEVSISTGALVAIAAVSVLAPALGATIGLNLDKVPYRGSAKLGSVDPWTTIARREKPGSSGIRANFVSLGF